MLGVPVWQTRGGGGGGPRFNFLLALHGVLGESAQHCGWLSSSSLPPPVGLQLDIMHGAAPPNEERKGGEGGLNVTSLPAESGATMSLLETDIS